MTSLRKYDNDDAGMTIALTVTVGLLMDGCIMTNDNGDANSYD
jgi:hypothetical protein